jgi:hypothetical protein
MTTINSNNPPLVAVPQLFTIKNTSGYDMNVDNVHIKFGGTKTVNLISAGMAAQAAKGNLSITTTSGYFESYANSDLNFSTNYGSYAALSPATLPLPTTSSATTVDAVTVCKIICTLAQKIQDIENLVKAITGDVSGYQGTHNVNL